MQRMPRVLWALFLITAACSGEPLVGDLPHLVTDAAAPDGGPRDSGTSVQDAAADGSQRRDSGADAGAQNHAPTLDKLTDQTTPEDTPLTLDVSASDVDGDTLSFSAQSSDQSIVADGGLMISTTSASGTGASLVITPVKDAFGSVTITLTVSDGRAEASTTFALDVTAVNDPPTVTVPGDQALAEDGMAMLAIQVNDVDTPLDQLTVTAKGDSSTLLPAGALQVSGQGGTRVLTVTPAGSTSGTATISVEVSDGSLQASATFMLTVTAVNDPPMISAIADQTIDEDTTLGPVSVTVTDTDNDPATLTLSASSSDQSVVADAAIVFGGSGQNRTLSLTPVANAFGTVTITVTVDDGIDQTSTSFVLTVSPVDDAPTLSLPADQTTAEDTPLGPVAFGVDDIDTALNALTVTASSDNQSVVADGGIMLGGSAGSRTISLTPVAQASGTAQITLVVSDGVLSQSGTFQVTVTSVDDPPSIAGLSNVTTNEDTPLGPLAFTVSDIDTPLSALIVTATSSDQNVLPDANLSLGGSGGNRTLTLTPAPNQNGSVDISVSVSDGTTTVSITFTLQVNPVNDPPSIAAIADQTIDEDTTLGPLTVTLSDVDTPATSLTLSATSSNQALVQDAALMLGGSGANRTLTLTPVANASGMATITLSASDGSATSQLTFVLTVNPVNDPPTLTAIMDQSTLEDVGVGPLAFTVNDVETPPGSLSVSGSSDNPAILTTAGIMFGGSGASRTVSLSFVPNANGTVVVSISVSDGAATTTETFTVTITPVNDPPTAVADNFTGASGTTGNVTLSGATSLLANDTDPDGPMLTAMAVTNLATTAGGSVTIQTDGTFVYTPPVGYLGLDSFSYTVTDNDPTMPLQDTGSVQIEVSSPMSWFVNNQAAPGGDGRDTSPFQQLKLVETAPVTGGGDWIIVAYGDGTTTYQDQGIILKPNQHLIGVASAMGLPIITNLGGPGVTLANGALVKTLAINQTAGAGIAGTGLDGALTIDGVEITGSTGAAVSTDLLGTGSLTINDTIVQGTQGLVHSGGTLALTGVVTIKSSGGSGLVLSNADLSGALASLVVTGAVGDGVSVTNTTGSLDLNNVAVSNNGGFGISLSNATVNVIGASNTVTTTAGTALRVDSSAANLTFSTVTCNNTTQTAVDIANHTGTIAFGSLSLTTSSATGLQVSGAGTLSSTQGSITTTTGRAVNISNATLNMVLTSISSNGADIGLSLSNTGGSFKVNGDGSGARNGSGGTIINTTSHGVSLNSATSVTLRSMNLTNTADDGVFGQSLTDTRLQGLTLTNNGDAAGDEGIDFQNVTGACAVDGCLITGSEEDALRLFNDSGSLTSLSVSGSEFRNNNTAAPGNDGVNIQASSSAQMAGVVVDGCTFDTLRATALRTSVLDSATVSIDITNSTFNGSNAGVKLISDGSGQLSFNVTNNIETNHIYQAITVSTTAASLAAGSLIGTLSGNHIGIDGVTNSGVSSSDGIFVDINGAMRAVVALRGNVVRGVRDSALWAYAHAGTGGLDLTLDQNDFKSDIFGLEATSLGSDDTQVMCVNATNNKSSSLSGADGWFVASGFKGTAGSFAFEGWTGTVVGTLDALGNTDQNGNPATASVQGSASAFGPAATPCMTP